MPADRVDEIATEHLRCGYPSRECDPIEAALAAGLGDLDTARLGRAIEGYHDPVVRLLIARAAATIEGARDAR